MIESHRANAARATLSLIGFVTLAFPCVAVTVKGGAGTAFWLLAIGGLTLGRSAWPKLEPWERKLLIGFLALLAVNAYSLVNTHETAMGISHLERAAYFALAIPAYLLLRHIGGTRLPNLILGCAAGGLTLAAVAVYQRFVQALPDAEGAYHKIVFGDVSALIATALFATLISGTLSRQKTILTMIGCFAALVAMALSGARGAWIFIPVGVTLALILNQKAISRTVALVVATVITMTLAVLLAWPQNPISERFAIGIREIILHSEDPTAVSSWGERLNMWQDSITIWRSSPWVGTGIGDFEHDSKSLIQNQQSRMQKTYGHAHSIYLHALATTGILGLTGLIVFAFALPAYFVWRNRAKAVAPLTRLAANLALIGIAAFAVFGLTEGWMVRSPMVYTYLVWLLLTVSTLANDQATAA